MKQTIFFLLAFVMSLSFAQNKGITFTKQIEYGFVSKEKGRLPDLYFKTLGNSNAEFLTQSQFSYFPMNIFTDNLGSMTVGIGLGNKLNYTNIGTFRGFSATSNDFNVINYTAKKLGTSETVLGTSCNHYLISFAKEKDADDSERRKEKNIKLCIDEKNEINNFNVLLGVSNIFDKSTLSGDKLNGLILKFGGEKDFDKEYLVAKSIKNINETVYFDHKLALEKQRKEKDSLIADNIKREAEWKKFEQTDSTAVVVDSAAVIATDSAAAAYDDSYAYIPKYKSEYKKDQHGEGDYAINNISTEKAWDILPKYCRNPEKDLPAIQNLDFKKHLENYSKQICDMYLTQNREHSVAVKQTMDEIRREAIFINENKERLSKPDQRKVEKYLNKLD